MTNVALTPEYNSSFFTINSIKSDGVDFKQWLLLPFFGGEVGGNGVVVLLRLVLDISLVSFIAIGQELNHRINY